MGGDPPSLQGVTGIRRGQKPRGHLSVSGVLRVMGNECQNTFLATDVARDVWGKGEEPFISLLPPYELPSLGRGKGASYAWERVSP
jgi:hypothetical protein